MATRLTLIAQGATQDTRHGRFPADDMLEPKALDAVASMSWSAVARGFVSPMRAARQTAAALGLRVKTDPALRDADPGYWAGRPLRDIAPHDLSQWLADPDFVGHGGESRTALAKRAVCWLNARAHAAEPAVAVTHAAVIRALIVHVLDAPDTAFLRIDIAPLTVTDLRHDGRRWALRMTGVPLHAVRPSA